jgi:hypothetical protein
MKLGDQIERVELECTRLNVCVFSQLLYSVEECEDKRVGE